MIALYPEAFAVITRADTGIRTFEDLRDRKIGIGMSGAGYTFTRDVVLKYYGWTISAPDRLLELGLAEQDQALCGNRVDAIIFEAGHPSGAAHGKGVDDGQAGGPCPGMTCADAWPPGSRCSCPGCGTR